MVSVMNSGVDTPAFVGSSSFHDAFSSAASAETAGATRGVAMGTANSGAG